MFFRLNFWVSSNRYEGFLNWWYPTTMGFPVKNGHFGVFWGYHHLRKHPHILYYVHFQGHRLSLLAFCPSRKFGIHGLNRPLLGPLRNDGNESISNVTQKSDGRTRPCAGGALPLALWLQDNLSFISSQKGRYNVPIKVIEKCSYIPSNPFVDLFYTWRFYNHVKPPSGSHLVFEAVHNWNKPSNSSFWRSSSWLCDVRHHLK